MTARRVVCAIPRPCLATAPRRLHVPTAPLRHPTMTPAARRTAQCRLAALPGAVGRGVSRGMWEHQAGRRQFLGALAAAPLGVAALGAPRSVPSAARIATQYSGSGITADQALELLLEGNRRFVAGTLTSFGQLVERRSEVASSQSPMATIVSCSDSRVPPEVVFDRTLGELFVVRTAGQVIDEGARSSIVYATDALSSPLVVVMGHSRCGAVDAALAAIRGNDIPGYAFRLAEAIGPAVRRALAQPGDSLDNAIRANVLLGVERVRESEPLLAEDVRQGRLRVVGAYYDFQTGQVSLLT